MSFYELVFITRQDLSQSQTENLARSLKEVLEKEGGKVVSDEYWGLRQLSYRIKKNRKGHYHLFNIESKPQALEELERIMKLNEDLLRFQIVRVDALTEGLSIQLRYRSERDDGAEGEPRREAFRGGRDNSRPRDGFRSRPSGNSSEEDSLEMEG